jgi:AcrR family transcriptional regulator
MDKMSHMSPKMNDQKTAQQEDRRIQRTQQALLDALLDLLKVRHYDAISVKDIIEKANVGRSTFYAHYQTKDDLLKGGFERVLEMLLEQLVFDETERKLSLDTAPLFRHAQGHAKLYRALAWGSGFELITTQGQASLGEKILQRLSSIAPAEGQIAVPLSILSYSLAGSLLILLKWWLENDMPGSPEYMDGISQQLIMPGFRNALGVR